MKKLLFILLFFPLIVSASIFDNGYNTFGTESTIQPYLAPLPSYNSYSLPVYVNGYLKNNGTWVNPYYRTAPDNTIYNNWSYPTNINPYKPKTYNINNYLKNYYTPPAKISIPTSNQFNNYPATTAGLIQQLSDLQKILDKLNH